MPLQFTYIFLQSLCYKLACKTFKPSSTMDWFSWLSKTTLDPLHVYEYGLNFACNDLKQEHTSGFNHKFLMSMGVFDADHRLEIIRLARKETGSKSSGVFSTNGAVSRLVLAVGKTKKGLMRCAKKMVHHGKSGFVGSAKLSHDLDVKWKGLLSKVQGSSKEERRRNTFGKQDAGRTYRDRFLFRGSRTPDVYDPTVRKFSFTQDSSDIKSGPLDRSMKDKVLYQSNTPIFLSGPLDGQMVERRMMITPNRSPVPQRNVLSCWSPSTSHAVNGKHVRSPRISTSPLYEVHSLWASLFEDMRPT